MNKNQQLPEGIEWPRYEDGELVCLGDEFMHSDGSCSSTVADIIIRQELFLIDGMDGHTSVFKRGERVKRPAPKMFDADGVEISVCDHGWVIDDPYDEIVVCKISNAEHEELDVYNVHTGNHKIIRANRFTHKRPDGWKRLEEDANILCYDIIWHVGDYSPSDFQKKGDSITERIQNLVTRAKAIAGVSADE